MSKVIRLLGLLAMVLLLGCSGGGGGGATTTVSGTVLLDGQPLEEGEIFFEEVDRSQSPSAAPIKNGSYTAQVPPGNKTVRISASKPGKPDPVMGVGPPEPLIAPEYNVNSTLKVTISGSSQSDVNFEVKSIKK